MRVLSWTSDSGLSLLVECSFVVTVVRHLVCPTGVEPECRRVPSRPPEQDLYTSYRTKGIGRNRFSVDVGVVGFESDPPLTSGRNLRVLRWNPDPSLSQGGSVRHTFSSTPLPTDECRQSYRRVSSRRLGGSPRTLVDERAEGGTSSSRRSRYRHLRVIDPRVLPWDDSDEVQVYVHSKT